MAEYAPGMRTIIHDEEWMVRKVEINNLGNKALHCVGITALVKDKEAIFLADLEEIQIVNPAEEKQPLKDKKTIISMNETLNYYDQNATSFKYGDYEGMRNGRYFTDFTEELFEDFMKDIHGLAIERTWITGDVREGRGDKQWINILLPR